MNTPSFSQTYTYITTMLLRLLPIHFLQIISNAGSSLPILIADSRMHVIGG